MLSTKILSFSVHLCLVLLLITISESSSKISADDEFVSWQNQLLKKSSREKFSTLSYRDVGKAEESKPLWRRFLNNRSVTCNDGTPAGYDINLHEVLTILTIAALATKAQTKCCSGWYCYDQNSCALRYRQSTLLMTSSSWRKSKSSSGILSSNPLENPYWWDTNHVFIPYCSSDCWSGVASKKDTGGYAFMGSLILQEVIHDLFLEGLSNYSTLILVGSSAGGVGVMINIDHISTFIKTIGYKINVRGVTDSGWFLDHRPFLPVSSLWKFDYLRQRSYISAFKAIKKGINLWKGRLPVSCRKRYRRDEWKCFFGYRLYPTIREPVFLFQWLYDEAQLTVDNVASPQTREQWDFVNTIGNAYRSSLVNISAYFAPSCISHTVLMKKDWHWLSIDGISLPLALYCWERSLKNEKHKQRNPTTYDDTKYYYKTNTDLTSNAAVKSSIHKHRKNKQLKNKTRKFKNVRHHKEYQKKRRRKQKKGIN